MYFCYIIYSEKLDRFYTGHTENLHIRIEQHNSRLSDFTSKATDWELVYSEPFVSREEAFKREREIKSKKSRKYLQWLIKQKE